MPDIKVELKITADTAPLKAASAAAEQFNAKLGGLNQAGAKGSATFSGLASAAGVAAGAEAGAAAKAADAETRTVASTISSRFTTSLLVTTPAAAVPARAPEETVCKN